jgi:ribosomal protein S18 acetylase RimI-like enzyme
MSAGCPLPNPALDETLLAQVEDAGINASAPREQRWIDGWLVRFSPAKAKRARCIQAVCAGRLPIAEKLSRCLPVYEAAGLQPYVRITPFSQPSGLDRELAVLGMDCVDETRVMVLGSLADVDRELRATALRFATVGANDFAAWVGGQRGSGLAEQKAHADRIACSPVPHHGVLAFDAVGSTVGAGQVVIEGRLAGIYDLFTAEHQRGRGVAESICRYLLATSAKRGASIAYLQVDAANEVARRIYRRLGFVDGYSYHYRTPAVALDGRAP